MNTYTLPEPYLKAYARHRRPDFFVADQMQVAYAAGLDENKAGKDSALVELDAWQPISTAQPTLSEQLQTLAELVKDMEDLRAENAQERRRLRQEVSILWEVAYDGIERGDAFYAVVQRRTGQPREQVEHHFLPKEPTK